MIYACRRGSGRRQEVAGGARDTGEMWGVRCRHSAARKGELRVSTGAQDQGRKERPKSGGGGVPVGRRRGNIRGGGARFRRGNLKWRRREREREMRGKREGSSAEAVRWWRWQGAALRRSYGEAKPAALRRGNGAVMEGFVGDDRWGRWGPPVSGRSEVDWVWFGVRVG